MGNPGNKGFVKDVVLHGNEDDDDGDGDEDREICWRR